ncbi:unnamed protein product [Pleuronectes platessa]|uniref:Uncharacterized protein n=1 Tax=Pleuronectes platessa TaxID=8262 RepID=A0A9N7VBU5_PLEPL|nr:unnamed protein product [Pleuronectes platessa]
MFKNNHSVSGCVLESPGACTTATLEPNVGLYTARDEDQKAEWELVRRMEDVVAGRKGDGGDPEAGRGRRCWRGCFRQQLMVISSKGLLFKQKISCGQIWLEASMVIGHGYPPKRQLLSLWSAAASSQVRKHQKACEETGARSTRANVTREKQLTTST